MVDHEARNAEKLDKRTISREREKVTMRNKGGEAKRIFRDKVEFKNPLKLGRLVDTWLCDNLS